MASNESQTQKLIGLYRSCECLWNPQSPGYLSSSEQEGAWRKITRGMNSGLTPDQVKLQVLALRNYYDAECAAIRKSKLEGYSHKPRHSYFHDLLFLGNVLSEETEESKVSFCLGQVSDILEDSLIRDDYEPNSLSNRDTDSKHDYTYYKLILEPEKQSISQEMENGEVMGKNSERSASGNDNARFYPTTYCVPCKKKKTSCNPRCQCTDTESSSSTENCGPCRAMNLHAHKCCSCVSLNEYQAHSQTSGCCGPPVRCRYAEPGPKLCCQPRPRYVPKSPPLNTGRDRSCCVSNWKRNTNAVYRRLRAELEAQETQNKSCRQTRERPRVKLPPLEDRNSGCYCKSQEGQIITCCCNSNDPIQNQSAAQEGRSPACCCNSQLASQESRHSTCCCNSSERRQSGADQMNVCSQPGIPQNCYQPPISLNCTNNNQQDLDYGRYTADCRNLPEPCNYCNGQQIPDSDIYINNQQMQNPGRYSNDPQGQQIYSNDMYFQLQTPKPAYYQQQQQCNTNQVQPTNSTKPAQQYVNYVPYQPGIDYGQASIPDQSMAYSYAVENSNYPPPCATTVPAQRPLPDCPPPQDVQNCQTPCQSPCHVSCQAPCAKAPCDTSRIGILNGQQEDDDPRLSVNKRDRQWQSDDVLRNNPTRRCNQNQGRYSDAEPDTQRRRSNDCDQDVDQKKLVCRKVDRVDEDTQRRRSNDCNQDVDKRQQVCRKLDRRRSSGYIEDTVRSRGLYNESPNRRGSRNTGPVRNYEECLSGRRQYAAERDVCSTDCIYEKCPSHRRRRTDDCDCYPETPTRRNHDIQEPRRTDQTICSRKPCPEFRKKPKRKEYVECTNQNCQSSKLPPKNYNCAQEPKAPADDVQYVPCPALRQTPRESPYHCQPDGIWKEREDRIAGKTRPPPRSCGYEDDRKASLPAMCPTKNRCRPPPEEIECECESEDETIPPKRRHRDNRQKRPSDDREDICCMEPKKRQENGKGRRELFETTCCAATCPYLPRRPHSQEPCASPRRKPTKCYDDEREAMNICRNQSPGRKIPRPRNDITDCERPKRDCTTVQIPKKKAPTDVCECSSDDNIYDQGKYDRYCDEGQQRSPRETFKCCPRRTERKNNARSQRGYPDEDDDCDDNTEAYCPKRGRKNMKNCLDDCCCSSESDECTKYKKWDNPGGSRRRGESPRNCQNYRGYREFDFKRPTSKTTSPCRQSQRTDVYESEYDCPSYTPKRYDKKPCPRKQEYKSKETDVYDSGYDCFCSSDDKKTRIERKPSPCSPRPRCKHCQREQKTENTSYVGCRLEKTVCRRKPIACQNKGPQNMQENATKDCVSEGNDFEFECECECKYNEEKNGKPNGTFKAQDVCTCNCGAHSSPFEPLTQSFKRNPAGDGSPFDDSVGIEAALNHASASANTTWQPDYKLNLDLPFAEEPKSVLVPECRVPLPIKKKKPRPGSAGPSKNSKSLKPKSTTASPTRNSAAPKTQPGESAKKRTTSLSNGKRNALGGARRTTGQGSSAAANSKLPNDLNTASYFICKLQDDANSQQYLIVVPKEQPIARCDTHRDDPGQGSWKQLHCQRQFSGFQSVSWGNPGSNSVFPSPPFHPIEGISERSSYADTTMRIVTEYLHQTMKASSPGLMHSFQPVISPRSVLKRVLAGQKRCHSVDRSSSKANAAILPENPLQNLSSAEDKKEVIVLLPPVVGFRPSKNSFNTDAVEVQRLTVRNSGTDVKPRTTPTKTVPPRPPNKPKLKALR